jgi:hypothetical protein
VEAAHQAKKQNIRGCSAFTTVVQEGMEKDEPLLVFSALYMYTVHCKIMPDPSLYLINAL